MNTSDTERDSPPRTWRQWRIPAKIYGRVRTSTVAFGICFVLTGLLYGHLSAEIDKRNADTVQGPTAIDPSELTPLQPQTYEQRYTSTTTPTPTTSADSEPSGSVDGPGQDSSTSADPGQLLSTTAPVPTSTAPFGVPIPPVIQSLIPTRPAPTSAR